jgi:hypothetical protein
MLLTISLSFSALPLFYSLFSLSIIFHCPSPPLINILISSYLLFASFPLPYSPTFPDLFFYFFHFRLSSFVPYFSYFFIPCSLTFSFCLLAHSFLNSIPANFTLPISPPPPHCSLLHDSLCFCLSHFNS